VFREYSMGYLLFSDEAKNVSIYDIMMIGWD
jgi:hypothetical protein